MTEVKDRNWFERQQRKCREEIATWPEWMRNAAVVATANAPASYWAQYYLDKDNKQ